MVPSYPSPRTANAPNARSAQPPSLVKVGEGRRVAVPESAHTRWGQRLSWALLAGLAVALALGLGTSRAFDGARVMASAQRQGSATVQRAQAVMQAINAAARVKEEARLTLINDHFNEHIAYRDDAETWGVVDYWASPLEMLGRAQGDCEDYAIAKYFSLIASGVPSAKMRLVYVRAQTGGTIQAHMVLAYYPYPNAEPLILDNLVDAIHPASARPDLTPVFSFNAEGLWQGVTGASAGDPSARLSKWRELIGKAKAEGWW